MSVKKDRAVESMLTPGRPFVVNILAQGKDKGVMKQLLKPFKPGEDRFQGLETEVQPPSWQSHELVRHVILQLSQRVGFCLFSRADAGLQASFCV